MRKRDEMAVVLSTVTGLRREHLEQYEPLKALLDKADCPAAEEETFDFGLVRFRWPYGYTEKGRPILSITFFETAGLIELRRLENNAWGAWGTELRSSATYTNMAQIPLEWEIEELPVPYPEAT